MRKIILLSVIIWTFSSCYLFQENGIEVKIINNSKQAVSNVKFSTTENLNSVEFKSIYPDKEVLDFLKITDNKTDGSYLLEFTRKNGEREHSSAGYYTNGGSLDSQIIFKIENDTVIATTSQY